MQYRKDPLNSEGAAAHDRTRDAGPAELRQGTCTSHVTDIMATSARGMLICGHMFRGR